MPKFNDLTGKTIGRLTFIESEVVKGKKRFWKVKCQCGQIQTYRVDYFKRMEKEGVRFECYKCKWERKSPTLTDKVFGRLTVLREGDRKDKGRWWLCRCDCGVEKEIPSQRLLSKKRTPTRSCGCLARKLQSKWVNTTQYPPSHKFKAKDADSRNFSLYHCRNAMVSSCYNVKDIRYKNHGALGHTVCELWRNGAKEFVEWALKNGYKAGDGVFLKENESIFSPQNCYVMSKKKRTKIHNSKMIHWKGKIQSITDWAYELGCSQACLSERLKKYEIYGIDKIMDLSWTAKRIVVKK